MHMKHITTLTLIALMLVSFVPSTSSAATQDLEVSGWIPYWRDSQGIKDAKKHIDDIDTVFPFAYTVTTQGMLADQAGLDKRDWQTFMKLADREDVEIIPTVMWSDGVSIHNVLSNPLMRKLHVLMIALMVEEGGYAGVDIDYEAKKSETKDYFSLFLAELKQVLGTRTLSCTIEARTPPASLYRVVPEVINYANDYKAIATHCDRVQIMAYDQQRADIVLNDARKGKPYMPVADIDWVRKVVELALKDIPKEKLVLGIPTYGHHYTVTVSPDWYRDYTRIGALNVPDMLDVAKEHRVTPTRNSAGEMGFSYLPKSSTLKLSSSLKIPKDTPKGEIVAARALAYANETGETVQFRVASYSDAGAMEDKIDLAQEYGLRGVALFKIDGEEDQKVWKYLE